MSSILIIEDSPIIREPLARLLAVEGYEVATATDGLAAQAEIRRRRPDLVLLDVMMPHMDGIAFLQFLRNDPHAADVAVVAVTAVLDSRRLQQLRDLNVKSIITKGTFTLQNLLTEVRQHISYPPPQRLAG